MTSIFLFAPRIFFDTTQELGSESSNQDSGDTSWGRRTNFGHATRLIHMKNRRARTARLNQNPCPAKDRHVTRYGRETCIVVSVVADTAWTKAKRRSGIAFMMITFFEVLRAESMAIRPVTPS